MSLADTTCWLQANILHLDMKSCNVLLAGDATAKVCHLLADAAVHLTIEVSGWEQQGCSGAPEQIKCSPPPS